MRVTLSVMGAASALLVTGAALGLCTSCTTGNQEASVAALESGLTAADILALQYTSLPACPMQAPACADPNVKTQIKAAAQTAYTTIKQAEAAAAAGQPVNMTAATAALAALQALVQANIVSSAINKGGA